VLLRWSQLPVSPLEHLEKLEQLRLIEAGIRIDTLEVEGDQFTVDTPEQLEQARAIAAGGGLVMGAGGCEKLDMFHQRRATRLTAEMVLKGANPERKIGKEAIPGERRRL